VELKLGEDEGDEVLSIVKDEMVQVRSLMIGGGL